MKRVIVFIMFFILYGWSIEILNAGVLGDTNLDGKIGLTEAVTALQVTSGIRDSLPASYVIIWKGSWKANENYDKYDAVKYNGTSYVCLQTHTSSEVDELSNASMWDTLALKGENGKCDIPFLDQSSNGYIQLGSIQIAWGNAIHMYREQQITFPVPFVGLPSVSLTAHHSCWMSIVKDTLTSSGFTSLLDNCMWPANFSWIAIGIFTQGGSTCSYAISPESQAFEYGGGTGNVTVTALAGCQWTAVSNAEWITVTADESGNGNGTVSYSVAQNTDAASRTGTVTVAKKELLVEQKGYIQDRWTSKTSMLTGRWGIGVSAVNEKIYAIGGQLGTDYNVTDYLNTVENYDPSTDTWTSRNSMPTRRSDFGCCSVNGKVYAIGGTNGNIWLDDTEEYNPTADIWIIKSPMPTARTGFACCAVNDKIYAIGGWNGSFLNTVEEYNPSDDTWITKASMPTARYSLSCSSVNGKLYAIGGLKNSGHSNIVEEYDPSTNKWSTKVSMLTSRNGLECSTVNGKIYSIGGTNGSGGLTNVEQYDPTTDTWKVKTPMLTGRTEFGLGMINDKIYAVGGHFRNEATNLNSVEEYTPNN